MPPKLKGEYHLFLKCLAFREAMIDFLEMRQCQEEGLVDIESLQDDERDILRHYCSLATEALLKVGSQRKSPVDQVVINAYRTGIALGLHLKIVTGEVQIR